MKYSSFFKKERTILPETGFTENQDDTVFLVSSLEKYSWEMFIFKVDKIKWIHKTDRNDFVHKLV